jgi:hypothetical protein
VAVFRTLVNICACCPIHLQLIATEALTLEGSITIDTSLTAPLTNSNALVDVFTGSAILSWCVSISTGAVEPSLSVGAQLRAVVKTKQALVNVHTSVAVQVHVMARRTGANVRPVGVDTGVITLIELRITTFVNIFTDHSVLF